MSTSPRLERTLTGVALVAATLTLIILFNLFQRPTTKDPRRRLLVGETVERDPEVMVERALVLLGSSQTPGETNRLLSDAWETLSHRYARGADHRAALFATVGVATDGDVRIASEWLRSIGKFEEVDVGRSWYNLGATAYIWSDTVSLAAIPQIVLVQRTIHEDVPGRIRYSDVVVLRRALGSKEIAAWANDTTPPPPYPRLASPIPTGASQ